MSIVLRAKLRKWQDRDIEGVLRRLNLKQGEMSYLVRRGFRMALVERGDLYTVDDLETAIERRDYGEEERS